MTWCDAGSRSRDSLPSQEERMSLMEGPRLSRVDQHLPIEVEGLPADFLTPILPEETAPSSSPLVVHVAINFTDPIIRSQCSLSYASSPTFVPTDRVCTRLLQHMEHCTKEFINRKDSRALDSRHEKTRTLKRQRFEITFRIFRKGSRWAERTLKSYQKQPLTVIFTKQVMLATHKMIEPFLRSRAEGFPWLDGSVRERDHGPDTVSPSSSSKPLPPGCVLRSPFVEASETLESTPGYSIRLSFRTRTQVPGQTLFDKVLKINSDQNAPLNLPLAEELFWDVCKFIEGSLSARELQFCKERGYRETLGGVTACSHLDDDAVHIDLQITNNVGLSYGHLHREFGSKLTLCDGSDSGNPQDFLKNIAAQLEHARDTIDDRISLMSDSEVRLLELTSPSWTIREPLEIGLDSGTCPTIQTVLERTIGTASHNLASEDRRPYAARNPSGRDVVNRPVTNSPPVGPPQPRQFFLVGRPITRSRSAGDKQDDTRTEEAQGKGPGNRPGEVHNPARSTSAPTIISFEEAATSSPPVFPRVAAQCSLAASQLSRMQAGAAAMNVPLEERETSEVPPPEESLETVEDVPRDKTRAEDALPESKDHEVGNEPELTPLGTAHLTDALQLPELSMEKPAAVSTTSNIELGPPIDLVRDTDLVSERSHSSARDWDSASSEASDEAEDGGAPVTVQYCHKEVPMINTYARSRIDVIETFDDVASQDNDEDGPEEDQNDDLPQASSGQEEQEYVTAPSTPGLSCGSESSPRYSILTTPIMMRTHAQPNDGVLAVSALDYAEEGPASQPEESVAHEAPFHIRDLDVGDHGESSSPADYAHIHINRADAALWDLHGDDHRNSEDCQRELPAADIHNNDQPASDVGSKDAEPDTIVDDREAYDYHYDAEREVQEASMIELPSSPTLGSVVDTWMYPEDENGSLDEATSGMGASVVDGKNLLGSEEIEVDKSASAVDASSISETEIIGPAEIQMPHSPDIQAAEVDMALDDIVSDSCLESPAVENNDPEDAVLPGLHPSSSMLSSEDSPMNADHTDIRDITEAVSDIGVSAGKEEHHFETEEKEVADETAAGPDARLILETKMPSPADIELPPSPEIQAVEVILGREDSVSDETLDVSATEDEGMSSYTEASETVDNEAEALPEPSSSPLELPTEDTLADTEDVAAENEDKPTFDNAFCLPEQENCFDDEETQVDDIEEAVESFKPEMEALPLSPEIQASEPDLQPEDITTYERLGMPTVGQEGDFSHVEESHDISTPSDGTSGPEMPSSPPMPSLGQTLVGAGTLDVEEVDATYDIKSNVSHEVFVFNEQEQNGVEELQTAAMAGLVPKVVIPDPVAVQLPPFPEVPASEAVLLDEEIESSEDIAALEAEQVLNGWETTASDAHIVYSEATARPELLGPQKAVPLIDLAAEKSVPETNLSPTTSDFDDQVLLELGLDSDELPTAPGTSQGNRLQEEFVSANLDTEAVEVHNVFHAHSDSSDLPTLFSPAISDWLLLSDPITPEALDSVEHPHPYDTETTAVLEKSAAQAEAVGVLTAQQEEEGLPRPTASAFPYLTAEEIPNPFEQLPSENDSACIDEQTEDLFNHPSEQATIAPHTPRRLTFPIPTPFSLRTSTFSPTSPPHPPSPVLSHYSFESRSSFSSDRHSTSPNRDSVDTIAPLPADSPQPEKEYRPSTAGWLGFHEAKPNRRFSMPLQHVWDPAGSDRGGSSSRPGTAASTATVRYSTYRRERKRPVLADRPRPMTSGALETVRAEDAQDRKGVLPKFVMLFAGMGFASKVVGGDGQQRG